MTTHNSSIGARRSSSRSPDPFTSPKHDAKRQRLETPGPTFSTSYRPRKQIVQSSIKTDDGGTHLTNSTSPALSSISTSTSIASDRLMTPNSSVSSISYSASVSPSPSTTTSSFLRYSHTSGLLSSNTKIHSLPPKPPGRQFRIDSDAALNPGPILAQPVRPVPPNQHRPVHPLPARPPSSSLPIISTTPGPIQGKPKTYPGTLLSPPQHSVTAAGTGKDIDKDFQAKEIGEKFDKVIARITQSLSASASEDENQNQDQTIEEKAKEVIARVTGSPNSFEEIEKREAIGRKAEDVIARIERQARTNNTASPAAIHISPRQQPIPIQLNPAIVKGPPGFHISVPMPIALPMPMMMPMGYPQPGSGWMIPMPMPMPFTFPWFPSPSPNPNPNLPTSNLSPDPTGTTSDSIPIQDTNLETGHGQGETNSLHSDPDSDSDSDPELGLGLRVSE